MHQHLFNSKIAIPTARRLAQRDVTDNMVRSPEHVLQDAARDLEDAAFCRDIPTTAQLLGNARHVYALAYAQAIGELAPAIASTQYAVVIIERDLVEALTEVAA